MSKIRIEIAFAILFVTITIVTKSVKSQVSISAASKIVNASNGFQLISYELFSGKKYKLNTNPRAIFFYIQGSEYNSVTERIDMLASAVILGGRVIMMEKRGCSHNGPDLKVCYQYAEKAIRVDDHLAVITEYLKDADPKTPVILIGGSEGGDVASVIAKKEKRITQLILIGSAGGWSQKSELKYLVDKYPGYLGCNSRKEIDSIIRWIETTEDLSTIWAGQPLRRWKTFLSDSSITYLKDITIPVLLIHGTDDQNVPVEAARDLMTEFERIKKSNLTFIEYANMDHTLKNTRTGKSMYPIIETDMIRWLSKTGVVSIGDADQFINRVKKVHKDLF